MTDFYNFKIVIIIRMQCYWEKHADQWHRREKSEAICTSEHLDYTRRNCKVIEKMMSSQ